MFEPSVGCIGRSWLSCGAADERSFRWMPGSYAFLDEWVLLSRKLFLLPLLVESVAVSWQLLLYLYLCNGLYTDSLIPFILAGDDGREIEWSSACAASLIHATLKLLKILMCLSFMVISNTLWWSHAVLNQPSGTPDSDWTWWGRSSSGLEIRVLIVTYIMQIREVF